MPMEPSSSMRYFILFNTWRDKVMLFMVLDRFLGVILTSSTPSRKKGRVSGVWMGIVRLSKTSSQTST